MMRNTKREKKKLVLWLCLLLTLGLGLGYAVLTEQLKLNGSINYDSMKWNVEYLDFFEGSTTYNGETKTYSELFDVRGTTYLASDGVHPTAVGYEFITPFIAEWMRTLTTYERDFEITTGDGSTSFTDEQIALLPTYLEFK